MINFFSQFSGNLGIPIHARNFGKALQKISDTRLIQMSEVGSSEFDDEIEPNYPGLVFFYPQYFESYQFLDKNYGYFIFEYTKIPKKYVDQMNQMDAIFTASKWGVKVLLENGVNVPCHVVRGGVNTEMFSPDSVYRGHIKNSTFNFLHIGKAEERKGNRELIHAFYQVFGNQPDIELWLSIGNPHVPNFSSEQYVLDILGTDQIPTNIKIIPYVEDIRMLYAQAHCCVFPTRAEGIGLPIVESIACGIPTIANYNSGTSEYLNSQNAILIYPQEMEPVYDKHFFPRAGEYGEWAKPDVDALASEMTWVYDNYSAAKDIGRSGAKWMQENFTWDHSARDFKKLLETL